MTNFTCNVTSKANAAENWWDNCTTYFSTSDYWAFMREEPIWQQPADSRWTEVYEFWEEVHNNGGDECTWECMEEYDCAADANLGFCKGQYCYDPCSDDF